MFCYLTGDNILFSNDAFGEHLASEFMFNDLVEQSDLMYEALKYYANILTPFSALVEKKIKDVLALHLPVDIICTSHGVVWRETHGSMLVVAVLLGAKMTFGVHRLAALRAGGSAAANHFRGPGSQGKHLRAGAPEAHQADFIRFLVLVDHLARYQHHPVAIGIISQA